MTTDADFARRTAELLDQEAQHPAGWWWCSFAHDDGFRGVAIVWARGIISAVREAKRRGLNPGGEVLAYEIAEPPERFRNKLLDKAEATEANKIAKEPA